MLEELINPRNVPIFTSFTCVREAVEEGGASPNVKYLCTGETLLQRLCYNASCTNNDNSDLLLTFSFLLSRPDIDVLNYSRHGRCVIHDASEVPNEAQFLETLLGESHVARAHVNVPTLAGGLTALHIACRNRMRSNSTIVLAMVRCLVNNNADVNVKTWVEGHSPLHCAVLSSAGKEVIDFLLEHGACIDAQVLKIWPSGLGFSEAW